MKELKSLIEKSDAKCPKCGAFEKENLQKKGFRKNKREEIQKYYCKKCGRNFVMKKMLNKSYPPNVILQSISLYNKGMTLEEVSKTINMKFGVKTYPRLISYWMKEFSNICIFRKIRKVNFGKSGFENPVFEKLIEHKQPYLYKYHNLKMDLFLTGYFYRLKDYFKNVTEICPHELFLKDNIRSSQIKIDLGYKDKIEIKKKNNYACKLAGLALKMAKTNKQRHQIVQDFMLVNDTATLAVEIPIWLNTEEIEKINSEFGIFQDFCGNPGENNITGHIDIVQARFGLIYVLDYKPESEKVDAVSQLFTYALALSKRTDIWLRNFRCAWFDENGYYEFNPNDIILAHFNFNGRRQFPESELKKYVLNEKAKNYFAGLNFYKNYNKSDDFFRKQRK